MLDNETDSVPQTRFALTRFRKLPQELSDMIDAYLKPTTNADLLDVEVRKTIINVCAAWPEDQELKSNLGSILSQELSITSEGDADVLYQTFVRLQCERKDLLSLSNPNNDVFGEVRSLTITVTDQAVPKCRIAFGERASICSWRHIKHVSLSVDYQTFNQDVNPISDPFDLLLPISAMLKGLPKYPGHEFPDWEIDVPQSEEFSHDQTVYLSSCLQTRMLKRLEDSRVDLTLRQPFWPAKTICFKEVWDYGDASNSKTNTCELWVAHTQLDMNLMHKFAAHHSMQFDRRDMADICCLGSTATLFHLSTLRHLTVLKATPADYQHFVREREETTYTAVAGSNIDLFTVYWVDFEQPKYPDLIYVAWQKAGR